MTAITETPIGIDALMKAKGLRRIDMQFAFDVTENTVRKWQKQDGMTRARIAELADFFGATADQVIGRAVREPLTVEVPTVEDTAAEMKRGSNR